MTEPVMVALATAWGFFLGLLVSYNIIKSMRKRIIADLRRAKRIYTDIDAQVINKTQLICKLTVNERKLLLIYVTSDSPLDYQLRSGDGMSVPVEQATDHTTLQ